MVFRDPETYVRKPFNVSPFADLPLLVSGLVFTPITPTAGRSRGISRALYDQMCGVWAEKREATTGEKEGLTKYQGLQEATAPK